MQAGNLKRSGSPELSESGTEKARKKPKKNPSTNIPAGGTPGSGTSTNGQPHQPSTVVHLKVPGNKLQQIMLTPPVVNKSVKKRKGGGPDGPGSGEDTAGEMSDASGNPKKQRIKMVASGRALSPSTSGNGSGMPPQRLDKSPLQERLRLLQQLNHHVRLHPIFFPGRMLT